MVRIFMNQTLLLKSMKSYFPAFLRIFLDRIIVKAPSIPHFKGLGMRSMLYEISIYQKINNKLINNIDFC